MKHIITVVSYMCDGCYISTIQWITPETRYKREHHWCEDCARQQLVESGKFATADEIENLADWYTPCWDKVSND